MPARKDIKKILIIGSGPIVIGQACEFDYSGSQAVKALKEEGYEVLLVNPNPATMMTTPGFADKVYMEPLTVPYVEEIIRTERPDAILSTMGGQTGLNLSLDLHEAGVLEKYNVEVIGANIDSIQLAEDRGLFKEKMAEIGLESAKSVLARQLEDTLDLIKEVGFPLILRPSFTLGGKGGSIAHSLEEFKILLEKAISDSPVHTVLVEESMLGWKEFEMEVMRDKSDNAIIVCSIENIDPMGVHTGDSITIAPIQTLSDREYQRMRTASIDILRAVGVDCGGSNVQFSWKPGTDRMVVIEMNPRVSRSSALASKATGFPIAMASAKLAVGYTLDEIINEITGVTVSCFEPALDYCAVKVPRFELEKFPLGYKTLGTQMKSVGESLAMGRTAIEAINKAIRGSEGGYQGLVTLDHLKDDVLNDMIHRLDPLRIFAIYTILKRKGPKALESIHQVTGYTPWFLYIFLEQIELENKLEAGELSPDLLMEAKKLGMSDLHIAKLTGKKAQEIKQLRENWDLHANFHFVDTCAGEFSAQTPFFYSTYGELDEGGASGEKTVMILASGPNRIGQGLEFDTCCTLASVAYRNNGMKTIVVNSNPETLSTDYNISDRLYLEPLNAENVLEILRKEQVNEVVVQLGGQTPLNMAETLEQNGVKIIGTPVESINSTEDRGLFAQLIKRLDLHQPENRMAANPDEVVSYSQEIGFPVLLRPSFVLGGRSMFIAYTPEELEVFLNKGIEMSQDRPVLVDQFLEDAYEYDVDAICDGKNVYVGGIMQHIEAAGVHSGDSACVFPPFESDPNLEQEMVDATVKIARDIGVHGFLNIQFAAKDGVLYILEVNPRASRTVPFLAKASGINLVDAVVKSWMGEDLAAQGLVKSDGVGVGQCTTGWAVKEAVFSFDRFADLDPLLGPEMKSTGEVIGTGESFGEAFSKAQLGVGSNLPTSGGVFVSVHDHDKKKILPIVRSLVEMGFQVSATGGTAGFLEENGLKCETIKKVQEGHPNVIDHLKSGKVDLLINTPKGRYSQSDDAQIRIAAVRQGVPYTTTTSAAWAALEGIRYLGTNEYVVRPIAPGIGFSGLFN